MNWDRHDMPDCEHAKGFNIDDPDTIVCVHCGIILSLTNAANFARASSTFSIYDEEQEWN